MTQPKEIKDTEESPVPTTDTEDRIEGRFAFGLRGDDILIQAADFVHTINKQTGEGFIDILGIDGRLYQIKEADVIVRVLNYPEEADITHFLSMRKQSKDLYEELMTKSIVVDKDRNRDVI